MARAPSLAGCLAAGLACVVASLALSPTTGAAGPANLLTNGGFETGVAGWGAAGGTLSAVDSPAYEGGGAAELAANGEAAARAYQAVSLVPGGSYQLSGQALIDSAGVQSVRIEISWQEADTGLWRWQSPPLTGTGGRYQQLSTALLTLPCPASDARVSVILEPAVNATDARVYVDELRLTASAALAPCPTPPAASTSTPTPPSHLGSPTPAPMPSLALLVNGGFETVDGAGALLGWRKQGGLLARASEPVHGGAWAASFQSNSTSTKWLYQAVPVTPGAWYELQAYVFDDDAMVEAAWLRISWYESVDASGSALDSVDSTEELAGPQRAYRLLTTGAVRAPPNARAASVRIMLRPRDATSALIYVDDVTFRPASAPLVPPGTASADGGATSGRHRASAASRASSGGGESDLLGVSQRRGAPTPLIHRRVLASQDDDAPSGVSDSWWLWAAAGGLVALGAMGWGVRWWRRRRG